MTTSDLKAAGHRVAAELRWPVKSSFLEYVALMDDGYTAIESPAYAEDQGFTFSHAEGTPGGAGEESLRTIQFRGGVVFTGHHGMLNIAIREPCLQHDDRTGQISIADPDWPGNRMVLAVFDVAQAPSGPGATPSPDGTWRGVNLRLTDDGADLFFRSYETGDPLDDFTVRFH